MSTSPPSPTPTSPHKSLGAGYFVYIEHIVPYPERTCKHKAIALYEKLCLLTYHLLPAPTDILGRRIAEQVETTAPRI
jgi:hypothetical protein